MRSPIIKILSTFFYTGYLPFIPGTFASIVGIFLFYLIKDRIFLYTLCTLILILVGFLVTSKAEKIFNKRDPRCVVIDEVAGILLTFMFLPYSFKAITVGFVLFRILDALKPYPINRIQELGGSIGIMGDDIVSGLYTNVILQLVLRGLLRL